MTAQKKPPPGAQAAASGCVEGRLYRHLKNTLKAADQQYKIDVRAVSAITTRNGGLFDWADDGPLAHTVEATDETGCIIDCAAWYPDKPGTWFLLRGEGRVLGAHRLLVCNPIRLVSTPAAWSSSTDPSTVCLLRWDRLWPADLFGCRRIICEPRLEARIMRRHRQQPPPFQLEVAA